MPIEPDALFALWLGMVVACALGVGLACAHVAGWWATGRVLDPEAVELIGRALDLD